MTSHVRDVALRGVLAREYTPIEKVNVMRGLIDTYATMWPQHQHINFRRDAVRLEVPVTFWTDRQAELTARRDLTLEWFAELQAPRKRTFSFDDAAHSVVAFGQLMNNTILPETVTTDGIRAS